MGQSCPRGRLEVSLTDLPVLAFLAGFALADVTPDRAVRPDLKDDVRGDIVNPLKPDVPYFTLLFLGLSVPADGGQGRVIPGIAAFYNHVRPFGGDSYLRATFQNMNLFVSAGSYDLPGPGWEGTLTGRGMALFGDATPFLYKDGRKEEDKAFYASNYGFGGSLGKWVTSFVRVRVSVNALSYHFARTSRTSQTFVLPPRSNVALAALELSGRNEQTSDRFSMIEGYHFKLKVQGQGRDTWRDWSLGREEDRLSATVTASAGRGVRFLESHNLVAMAHAGWGEGLDGITKFKLGSGFPPSTYVLPVHGYYFSEMKGDAYFLANMDEGFRLTGNIRCHVYLDAGTVWNRVGPMVPSLFGRETELLGFGAALDMRLGGLVPVYLGYGYAPLAERMGRVGGHEVLTWLIAGF